MLGGFLIGLYLVCGVLAVYGLPLLCVGLIVRLCEGSWGKRAGEMGSRKLLLGGGLLVGPLVVRLVATGRPF